MLTIYNPHQTLQSSAKDEKLRAVKRSLTERYKSFIPSVVSKKPHAGQKCKTKG